MHWADRIAKKLAKKSKEQVIASGISISGHLHIGHSNEVLISDAVKRALERIGVSAEVVWYADDFDPLRRIPWPLSEGDYEDYLGVPYADIPSPDPEYGSFVDFFERPFLDTLEDFGVDPDVYSSAEVYESGQLTGQIRTALESAEEIRQILNKYRSNSLPEDWLPFDPICEKCGRIATTRAYDWDGDYVYYSCEGSDYVEGCGHEGKANFMKGEGKLTWRVEWPARWDMLGVTCEPFGKDHAAAGGSYDTGKLIAKEIYNIEPPEPVPYEWISLKGEAMSSSKGRVFTLQDWLEVADPEMLRYFIFRSKALKAKDFDPALPLIELYKEYRQLEDVYFGVEEAKESRATQMERVYELSQIEDVPESRPQRIPFSLATVLVQVSRDKEHVLEVLERKEVLQNPEEWEIELAEERLDRAKSWVEKYAPENARVEILEELPDEIKNGLSPDQKECLSTLADDLSERDFSPVDIHNRVYETARSKDLKPVKLFQAIYLVLLGQKHGPRVGNFLTALDDEFVVGRFRSAAG